MSTFGPMIGIDTDNAIVFLNHAARTLTGVGAVALGKPLLEVLQLTDDSSQQPASDLAALKQTGRNWTIQAADQKPVPLAISISKMRSDQEDAGTVLVLRVATDERERERMVAETESARADAEAANRMKDDFLRMVSHELRAPLNAILGWADVMLRKSDPATVAKGSETIRRNVRAQSALIDSMLDVAAIASGRFTIARRPTDVYEVIEEARRSIEPTALAKKLTLLDQLEGGAPSLYADPQRLQQVLANLYSNAIKFTPAGGSITTRVRTAEKSLVIEVEDTGQGMSAATIALLFERSAQGSELARSQSGLGLGLRIARRIVELHGGQLAVESSGDNLGTRLRVILPWEMPAERATSEDDTLALEQLVGLRVLVVDDDPQAALLLANVLEALGSVVQTADSASRALDLYQRFEPQALLSDIGMSSEDGYWLIASIRAREAQAALPRITAVAVTAYSRPEDRERSRQAGFDAHLSKPMPARSVALTLGETRARANPAAAAPSSPGGAEGA